MSVEEEIAALAGAVEKFATELRADGHHDAADRLVAIANESADEMRARARRVGAR